MRKSQSPRTPSHQAVTGGFPSAITSPDMRLESERWTTNQRPVSPPPPPPPTKGVTMCSHVRGPPCAVLPTSAVVLLWQICSSHVRPTARQARHLYWEAERRAGADRQPERLAGWIKYVANTVSGLQTNLCRPVYGRRDRKDRLHAC